MARKTNTPDQTAAETTTAENAPQAAPIQSDAQSVSADTPAAADRINPAYEPEIQQDGSREQRVLDPKTGKVTRFFVRSVKDKFLRERRQRRRRA